MTPLEKFKAFALVALAVFLGSVSYLVIVTAQTQKQLAAQALVVLDHANNTLTTVDGVAMETEATLGQVALSVAQAADDIHQARKALVPVIDQLDQTLLYINQKCQPVSGQIEANCGTLADLSRTLQTTRLAIGTFVIAGKNFDTNESTFYNQEAVLFSIADNAFTHFDALVSSKDLSDGIKNSSQLAGHLSGASAIVEKKINDTFYPPACTSALCKVKEVYNIIKFGSELMEPTYYGWELWKDAH